MFFKEPPIENEKCEENVFIHQVKESFSAFVFCSFPVVGFIGEKLGLSAAFGIIGLIFIPAIIFIIVKLKNISERIKGDESYDSSSSK